VVVPEHPVRHRAVVDRVARSEEAAQVHDLAVPELDGHGVQVTLLIDRERPTLERVAVGAGLLDPTRGAERDDDVEEPAHMG
jgi:hypothetical protein